MPITISKSRYMAGVQCLKRLYLLVHQPELGRGKTASDFALFEQGRQVGKLAQKLFPGGVLVRAGDRDEAIRITRELVANPDVPAVFEAAFEHEGILVRVDILHRRKDGRWRFIEVKSSTSMKDEHPEDVAIQYRVLSQSGLDVASCHLATVNRQYVYPGGDIDPWRFFRIRNLTREVKRLQTKLAFQLRSEFRVLGMDVEPDLPTGKHCVQPNLCEFYDHCNPPRPDDYIGYLPYLHASAMEELEEIGIESIRDMPEDFPLGDRQRRAATCVQTGEPWFDGEELKKELASLTYPIFFMDFESINPAIPRFRGMHPFDHLCFQYSVHLVRKPSSEPEYYEFLAEGRTDPRRDFITGLCSVLGERGSIAAYNAGFESGRLADLAAWLPEFADRIKNIQARLWDLLPVIRNNVYHPEFQGSYSLKSVLPALVPDMSYKGMAVADGVDAGLAWESLTRGGLGCAEHEHLRKALLDYCKQDTMAMVRLLEVLMLKSRLED